MKVDSVLVTMRTFDMRELNSQEVTVIIAALTLFEECGRYGAEDSKVSARMRKSLDAARYATTEEDTDA